MKILKTMTNTELEAKLQKYFLVVTECTDIAIDIDYDTVYVKAWGRSGENIQTFIIELPLSDESYLFETFEDFALFITSSIVRILVN